MLVCLSEQRHFDQACTILDSENRVGLWSEGKCIVLNLVLSSQFSEFCESQGGHVWKQ